MIDGDFEYISKITKKAIDSAQEFQPWENYFRLHAKLTELFLSMYDFKNVDKLLEIGCGNGFNAALFSSKAKEVFATDLYRKGRQTHSIGIEKTQGLLKTLEVDNCFVLSCSGSELPFKNDSFDCVLTNSVLEHIGKRFMVIKEEKRVLKKGGLAVNIVPNFVERIFYFPTFYMDIFKKLIKYLLKKEGISEIRHIREGEGGILSLYSRFKKNYTHFPMPEPHGEYISFFVELKEYMPEKWLNLFRKNDMDIVDVFSTMIIPKPFLELFINGLEFYEKHSGFNKRLGRLPGLRFLGQNLCIITRKA